MADILDMSSEELERELYRQLSIDESDSEEDERDTLKEIEPLAMDHLALLKSSIAKTDYLVLQRFSVNVSECSGLSLAIRQEKTGLENVSIKEVEENNIEEIKNEETRENGEEEEGEEESFVIFLDDDEANQIAELEARLEESRNRENEIKMEREYRNNLFVTQKKDQSNKSNEIEQNSKVEFEKVEIKLDFAIKNTVDQLDNQIVSLQEEENIEIQRFEEMENNFKKFSEKQAKLKIEKDKLRAIQLEIETKKWNATVIIQCRIKGWVIRRKYKRLIKSIHLKAAWKIYQCLKCVGAKNTLAKLKQHKALQQHLQESKRIEEDESNVLKQEQFEMLIENCTSNAQTLSIDFYNDELQLTFQENSKNKAAAIIQAFIKRFNHRKKHLNIIKSAFQIQYFFKRILLKRKRRELLSLKIKENNFKTNKSAIIIQKLFCKFIIRIKKKRENAKKEWAAICICRRAKKYLEKVSLEKFKQLNKPDIIMSHSKPEKMKIDAVNNFFHKPYLVWKQQADVVENSVASSKSFRDDSFKTKCYEKLDNYHQFDIKKGISIELLTNRFEISELRALKCLSLNVEEIDAVGGILHRECPSLTSLDLNSNLISHTEGMNNLLHLQNLLVRDNKITTLSLLNLPKLVNLEIDVNCLSSLSGFEKLPLLKNFSAAHNTIVDISQVQYCSELENVILNHNKIHDISKICWYQLNKLQKLDLGKNLIESFDGKFISNCHHLLSLILYRNKLTKIPPFLINPFLRELWLNGNEIEDTTGWGEGESSWLPSLQYLYLNDNKISILSNFDIMPHLQVLDLSFNNLDDLNNIQQSLRNLKYLKSLYLHDNPIASLPNYRLEICKHLPYLSDLDDIPFTESEKVTAVYSSVKQSSLFILPSGDNNLLCKKLDLNQPLKLYECKCCEFTKMSRESSICPNCGDAEATNEKLKCEIPYKINWKNIKYNSEQIFQYTISSFRQFGHTSRIIQNQWINRSNLIRNQQDNFSKQDLKDGSIITNSISESLLVNYKLLQKDFNKEGLYNINNEYLERKNNLKKAESAKIIQKWYRNILRRKKDKLNNLERRRSDEIKKSSISKIQSIYRNFKLKKQMKIIRKKSKYVDEDEGNYEGIDDIDSFLGSNISPNRWEEQLFNDDNINSDDNLLGVEERVEVDNKIIKDNEERNEVDGEKEGGGNQVEQTEYYNKEIDQGENKNENISLENENPQNYDEEESFSLENPSISKRLTFSEKKRKEIELIKEQWKIVDEDTAENIWKRQKKMSGFANAAKKRDERRNPVVRYAQFMQQQGKTAGDVSYKALIDGPVRPLESYRNDKRNARPISNDGRSETGSVLSEIDLERYPSARSNSTTSSIKGKLLMNNFLPLVNQQEDDKKRLILPPIHNNNNSINKNKKEIHTIKYRPRL